MWELLMRMITYFLTKLAITNKYQIWIDDACSGNYLNPFKYSEFTDIEIIGYGGFGCVYKARWKHNIFALKSFSIDKVTLKEVVNEIKLQTVVHFHENIIKLCGITKTDDCWSSDPNERPDMRFVASKLESIYLNKMMHNPSIPNINIGNGIYLSNELKSIIDSIFELDINDFIKLSEKIKSNITENSLITLNQATASSTEYVNELFIFLINQLTRKLIEMLENIWLYKLFHYYNASNKKYK
ncbi:1292_t:CDS:2 [Funneliformis mosseae]|uniref:1292_t:CDS:1 n=1 Tax=Funneliformis mosseae TaxID=27381 RepID=A0A9N9GFB1_FUNMO|nr:1292_t:CDS:2 [Funneliformis mosseae]